MEVDEEEQQAPIIRRAEKDEEIKFEIPICCKEGHEDCPHVAKPQKKKKVNIGL
jgi:hypothetical protein